MFEAPGSKFTGHRQATGVEKYTAAPGVLAVLILAPTTEFPYELIYVETKRG